MKKFIDTRAATALLLVVCLTACGGGGGGSTQAAPATPVAVSTFNVEAAFATLFSTPVSFPSLSATDSAGNAYIMSLSYTPSADYVFNGKTYKQSVQNTVIKKNGAVVSGENLGTQYLFSANPTTIGAILVASRGTGFDPITYTPLVLSVSAPLPTASTVGATGTYASVVSYARQLDRTSTSKSSPTGNSSVSWSVESDTQSTAFACMTTALEKDCLKINSAGNIQGGKITVSIGGQTLTFQ